MGIITRSFANNILTAGKFDGTKLSGDIPQSNLTANAPAFDDDKIVNDLSTLGLRVHTQENLNATNTNSQYVDVFQDTSGYTNGADTVRNASEYVSTFSASETSSSTNISWAYRGSLNGLHYQRSNNSGPDLHVDGNDASDAVNNILSGYDGQSASGFSEAVVAHYHSFLYDLGPNVTYTPTHYDYYFQDGQGSLTSITVRGFNTRPSSQGFASDNETLSTRNSATNGNSYTDTLSSTSTKFRYLAFVKYYSAGNNWGNLHSHRIRGTMYTTTSGVNATGNFTCPAITAGSATTKMGAVITYQDNSGTNALNSDIVLQLSADNGSNFSTATLTALPDFSSGIKMAKVNDLAVTSGTQLKYKISFANQAAGSKEARIRGVSLNY